MVDSYYTQCGICKIGILIPVNLNVGDEHKVRYRCTNPECNLRFDEHGYEEFDVESQSWKRRQEG